MITNAPLEFLGGEVLLGTASSAKTLDGMPDLRRELELRRYKATLGETSRARLYRPVRANRRLVASGARLNANGPRMLLSRDGVSAYSRRLDDVSTADLVHCHPMRDFSRRHGQTNKPVAYFSRTLGDHVACESQHERRFALIADWHPDIVHIAAQPFTIEFGETHELNLHTPDFALITRTGGVLVVDVKRPERAVQEAAVERHALVREVLARAAMDHHVWVDAPTTVTDNLANFAAARVPERVLRELAPTICATAKDGTTVERLLAAAEAQYGIPTRVALVIVRRLLWDHVLVTDLLMPFSTRSEVVCL